MSLPVAPLPAAELDQLRREEELSRAALAVSPRRGEQRSVHRQLLRQLGRRRAELERGAAAVAAGWMPFRPSASWVAGLATDPRLFGGRIPSAATLAALPFGLLAGWLVAAVWQGTDALGAALLAITVVLALAGVLHQALAALQQRRLAAASRAIAGTLTANSELSREAWQSPSSWDGSVRPRSSGATEAEVAPLLVFNAPMPARALAALRAAQRSRLFDELVVCSPRPADFRQVTVRSTPSLGLLDPVLVGIIGAESFLVTRWDLAQDLQSSQTERR